MSSVQSIIDELQDVETAFEKLSKPEVYDFDNREFRKAQQKQQLLCQIISRHASNNVRVVGAKRHFCRTP